VISEVLVVFGVLVDVTSDGDVSDTVSLIELDVVRSVVKAEVGEGDVDSEVLEC
jgi:hypothetical protein